MTSSEDYFDEPDKFTPERWSKNKEDALIHPFASLPFGFGQRGCYGNLTGIQLFVTSSITHRTSSS